MKVKENLPKIFAVLAIVMTVVPVVALAQTPPSIWPTGFWGPLLSCTGDYAKVQPQGTQGAPANPCQSLCDLILTIINVIYFAMSVALFIIAPILLAVGGVMIMIAGASPEMLSQGKRTLTATVIGIVIVLCSYLLISTFINLVLPYAASTNLFGGFGAGNCPIPAS